MHALGTSWADWANHGVRTKASPCSGAAELGRLGTPPPQNAPQAPTDEGEAVRALRFPGREPARPWVIACIRAR